MPGTLSPLSLSLPDKPISLRMGLCGIILECILQSMGIGYILAQAGYSDLDIVGAVFILLGTSGFLISELWFGSNVVRWTFLAAGAPPVVLSLLRPLGGELYPSTFVSTCVLAIPALIGMLHPLTSFWYQDVARLRDNASRTQKNSVLRRQQLRSFTLIGGCLVTIYGVMRVQGFAPATAFIGIPAGLLGIVFFLVQSVKRFRMKG